MAAQSIPVRAMRPKQGNFWKIPGLFLAGGGFGYFIGKTLKAADHAPMPQWWVPLMLPMLMLMVVALHEAGHVAAGLACGFRFLVYIVGPLRIEREGEKLVVSRNRAWYCAGGLAACAPTRFGSDLRWRTTAYAAGGPIMSVLGAGALLVHPANANLNFLLLMFGVISGSTALATLIPIGFLGQASDGSRVLMMMRNEAGAQRWMAMGVLARLSTMERPRDWPQALIELMGDGLDMTTDGANVCFMRYLWHSDRAEWAIASMWLKRGLEKVDCVSKATLGILHYAAANFEAWQRGDAKLGREYLQFARESGVFKEIDLHVVNGAVLVAEGRTEEALAELALAEKTLVEKNPRLAAAGLEEIVELRDRAVRL